MERVSVHAGISKKVIEREVSATLGPLLNERGFELFERGATRRRSPQFISVVQIEFFDRRSHLKWGTTPYSFAIPIGIFLPFVPSLSSSGPRSDALGRLSPDTTECHIRGTIKKSIRQLECKIPNVWYVDPQGTQLGNVLEDVHRIFASQVFAWFDKFSNLCKLLEMLREDPDDQSARNDCWGWGRLGSPVRLALTGMVAFELEEWGLVRSALDEVLRRGGLSALTGSRQVDEAMAQKREIARTQN